MQSELLHDSTSVLVVGNQAVSKMIRYNLEDEKTHVIEAETGLDSMRILDERRVDLILVCLRLPDDLNEWSILSRLRSKESQCNTPIIVICPEPPRRSLIQQFRPNDYIQAPFDVRHLLLRVRKVIERNAVQHSQ